MKLGLAFFITLLICACSTTPLEKFERVQIGMSKDEVLESLGSPKIVRRKNSTDFWIYIYPQPKAVALEREIQFVNGSVISRGEKTIVTPDAATQDEMNATLNKKLDAEVIQEKLERQKNSKDFLDGTSDVPEKDRKAPNFQTVD